MADKAIWSGELCFGMVNIPFSLHVTRKSKDITFKQLSSEFNPVGRKLYDKVTGDEITGNPPYRCVEHNGQQVVVEEAELASLTPEKNTNIQIEAFFKVVDFDFTRFDTHYAIVPTGEDPHHLKAFGLLSALMINQGTGAFVRIKLRHREQLALVHYHAGSMILSTLFYDDEIIRQPHYDWVAHTPDEFNAGMALMKSMTVEDGHYEEQEDHYRNAVMDLVTAQIYGKEN